MSKMTQLRAQEGLKPGELARTSTRLNVEKPRPRCAFPRRSLSFPSHQGAPFHVPHCIPHSHHIIFFEQAEYTSHSHCAAPERLKHILNMASVAVGLDRTRLLKPLIVLAGWTFVQEVSS